MIKAIKAATVFFFMRTWNPKFKSRCCYMCDQIFTKEFWDFDDKNEGNEVIFSQQKTKLFKSDLIFKLYFQLFLLLHLFTIQPRWQRWHKSLLLTEQGWPIQMLWESTFFCHYFQLGRVCSIQPPSQNWSRLPSRDLSSEFEVYFQFLLQIERPQKSFHWQISCPERPWHPLGTSKSSSCGLESSSLVYPIESSAMKSLIDISMIFFMKYLQQSPWLYQPKT